MRGVIFESLWRDTWDKNTVNKCNIDPVHQWGPVQLPAWKIIEFFSNLGRWKTWIVSDQNEDEKGCSPIATFQLLPKHTWPVCKNDILRWVQKLHSSSLVPEPRPCLSQTTGTVLMN